MSGDRAPFARSRSGPHSVEWAVCLATISIQEAQVREEQVFVRPSPVDRAAGHPGGADDVFEAQVLQADGQAGLVDHRDGRGEHALFGLGVRVRSPPAGVPWLILSE